VSSEEDTREAKPRRFAWPRALLILGTPFLLFCVALASNRASAGVGLGSGPGDLWVALAEAFLNLFVVLTFLGVVLLVFIVYLLWPSRGRRDDRSKRFQTPAPWWLKLLGLLMILSMGGALVATVEYARKKGLPASAAGILPTASGDQPTDTAGRLVPLPIQWRVLTALALGCLVALTVIWIRARSHRPASTGRPTASAPAELQQVIDISLDELADETDPRRAVIKAYAGMEQILARHALARRPSEAPGEYLSRSLAAIHVGHAAAERLSRLFVWARFSQHEVGPEAKREAIEVFLSLRDEFGRLAG
jgi:hypothetical protein